MADDREEAALRLGRKEGGEEVLDAVDGWMSTADDEIYDEWCIKRGAVRAAFGLDARPLPSSAVSDASSGVGEGTEAGSEPQGLSNRLLDLDRVIGVKWGDKLLDPREVVYVLREDT